jgi:hypothetical protein
VTVVDPKSKNLFKLHSNSLFFSVTPSRYAAEVGVQEMVTPLPKGANYKNKVFHCALFSVYFDYSDESDYYLDETEKEEDEEEGEGEEGGNEEVEEDEVEEESSEGDFEKSETLIIFRI